MIENSQDIIDMPEPYSGIYQLYNRIRDESASKEEKDAYMDMLLLNDIICREIYESYFNNPRIQESILKSALCIGICAVFGHVHKRVLEEKILRD
ncbi:MAG: hypothetical protein C5B52_13915 [Bacteroidetes bacterium]|nr:MAG: hypothetical protein C5B52_13915 [Bacteroidota bacterium]